MKPHTTFSEQPILPDYLRSAQLKAPSKQWIMGGQHGMMRHHEYAFSKVRTHGAVLVLMMHHEYIKFGRCLCFLTR